MELRHLRYFVAVAEELNFTRAAERLYIAQPPLSTQIRALEDELKTPLFVRDKRRVFLTQAGRELLGRARAILASVEDVKSEALRAASGETGRLEVGYAASAMLSAALPSVLRSFRDDRPAVHLQLSEMSSLAQLDAIHARTLDVGVLRRPDVALPAGLVLEEWLATPLVAAIPVGHPLAKAKPVAIADLREQPLVMYPRDAGIGLYWKVQALCAKAGFRPRMVQEARDTTTIVGLVAAGAGIAVVPQDTQRIALDGVAYQRIADREATSALHLASRQGDRDPHVRELLQRLRAVRKASRRGT